MLQYSWMNTFIVVADELHFGRAAKRLNLAQPAVSQHIQNLEKTLKVRLFNRDRRTVKLTDAGMAFLQPCKDALTAVELAANSATNAGSGDVGSLRLGYNAAFASDEAVELVRLVAREFPKIGFQMDTGRSNDELIADLEQRSLDLAILGGPPVGKPDIDWYSLRKFTFGVLMRRDHLLAQSSSLSLEDLADEQLIMVRHTGGKTLQSLIVGLHETEQVPMPAHLEVLDVMSLFTLCLAGLGVGFGGHDTNTVVPADLCTVPLVNETNYRVGIAWRKDAVTPPLHNVLELARTAWPV